MVSADSFTGADIDEYRQHLINKKRAPQGARLRSNY